MRSLGTFVAWFGLVAACGGGAHVAPGAAQPAVDAPPSVTSAPTPPASAPPSIPPGWVMVEGEGWRGAFPVAFEVQRNDAPPPPVDFVVTGIAPIALGRGAMVQIMGWPRSLQDAEPGKWERDYVDGFREQVHLDGPPPVVGTYRVGEVDCPTYRFSGQHASGAVLDLITAVCHGSGFSLGWIGAPSRLDELVAHFEFRPAEVAP